MHVIKFHKSNFILQRIVKICIFNFQQKGLTVDAWTSIELYMSQITAPNTQLRKIFFNELIDHQWGVVHYFDFLYGPW